MKYCSKCLYPDTKPYIQFDKKGVCNACKHGELKKAHIDLDRKSLAHLAATDFDGFRQVVETAAAN